MTLTTSYWPAVASTGVRDITLPDLLREGADVNPDRVALVDAVADVGARREWTYAELLDDVERYARALLAEFSPGDRIAVFAPNSADWVILQQAIAMSGMIVVAANPAYRVDELEYVLRQSQASAIFYQREYRGADLGAIVAAVTTSVDSVRLVVPDHQWQQFAAGSDSSVELPAVAPTDPVQIQYTSGTTGFPKGALLHHKGIVNEATFVFERAGMSDGGVCINAMPMYHIGGGAVTELGTLSAHGTYVVLPGFDPATALEAYETYRGTHGLFVPTMLLALLDHPDGRTRDLSSMQTVLSGAAAVPEALVRRVTSEWNCDFSILFGQTEMHGVISQTRIADSPTDQATTVGQPLPELEVRLVDPITGTVVPIGEQGEICCRGYQNMLAYYNMPEATAVTIDADGWLHMGDLATMDDRGFLKITGRLKEMIIRGGVNIYPREIEELLFGHPDIGDAIVVGVPDDYWGEQVAAVLRAADPSRCPDPDDLKNWCRERISAHKVPTMWFFADEFPMTPSGKIQKFKVRDAIAHGDMTPDKVTGGKPATMNG
ncbi:putative fatty-acid--CoA ligase [Gordonia polyisoprenivorans NBRC 16320 = JCM 10675]|uniref:AMP-binding protein n=1 Tax=Gordonia polyisoprenivorans TaxID=84595 RepID=A0A846WKV5_9ACTN|nr:AMP-binding protein [Gordonia polyisoprenivorans]NKY01450.1 AMP-binding protein [Gordonia polyisoprenivorans]GAB26331.1 putative fatty-acid--CoA ligase [Gordonia polyisoprenivorans NBRC 16320 = JCM 10675]